MSTSKQERRDEEGFTLVEIMVSFGLLTVILVASLPVFIAMLGSTLTNKMSTQGKNLSQERLELLRDLRFHVDRQNGPFLDLLDLYYTNATSSGPTTSVTTGALTLTGRYISAGAHANGLPAAPYYLSQTGALPGAINFRQDIATQFLAADGTVLDRARYENNYNSQVAGADDPPSLIVGMTVVTRWTQAGKSKTLRTYTQITDGRPEAPVIQSQARAVAVDITSTAIDSSTLELQAGLATLDGAQSSGSSLSGYVGGVLVTRTRQSPVTGEVTQFALPGVTPTTSGDGGVRDPGGCAWYAFGKTRTENVTGDITGGVPISPVNVGAGTPNVALGALVTSGNPTCGLLSFDNQAASGVARVDALGTVMGAVPYVRIPDTSGSSTAVFGSGYVTATPLTGVQQVKSGARTGITDPVVLFPNSAGPAGAGLVSAMLTGAEVNCISRVGTTPASVRGKYVLTLKWWGRTATTPYSPRTAVYTYDSSASPALTVTGDAWQPNLTFVDATGTTLGQLVQAIVPSATQGTLTTGESNGLRGFPAGVLQLTTASTLSPEAGPGFSAIKVQLGQMTCVAVDQR